MTRYVAFLRGVNLGKRQARGADLKAAFEALGLTRVRTLLASGNVMFEAGDGTGLRQTVEAALERRFGFEIGVVLRTIEQIRAMRDSAPFGRVDPGVDAAFHVLLLAEPMTPKPRLDGVAGDYDIARIDAGEVYFRLHRKPDGTYLGRSALKGIDKLLPRGQLFTMRNWNTLLKAAST